MTWSTHIDQNNLIELWHDQNISIRITWIIIIWSKYLESSNSIKLSWLLNQKTLGQCYPDQTSPHVNARNGRHLHGSTDTGSGCEGIRCLDQDHSAAVWTTDLEGRHPRPGSISRLCCTDDLLTWRVGPLQSEGWKHVEPCYSIECYTVI